MTTNAHAAGIRRDIDRLVPAGWVWQGACPANNEFWGCDIHEESIDWLSENLAPMRGGVCGHEPGVPLASGSVDLIWASSVFTHLTDHWSGWLLELHRLLGEGGILVAAFLGDAMAQPVFGEECDDDRIGMNVSAYDESFDAGGPNVLMSPWWIQAHWGRAFDILRIEPSGFTGVAGSGQGIIVARKKLAPQVIAENHQLAEQVIELAREAAVLEREIERLKAQVPASS